MVFNDKLKNVIRNMSRKRINNSNTITPWQLKEGKNVKERYNEIRPVLKSLGIKSVLDIGCNAGVITRLAGQEGYFSVGIDKEICFKEIDNPLEKACIGKYEIDEKIINMLPKFDATLLLSIHHHFIREFGDEVAKRIVSKLAYNTNKLMIIEAASLNSNYGKEINELFIDNNDESVVEYITKWLVEIMPNWDIEYIWKNVRPISIGSRYLFKCERANFE